MADRVFIGPSFSWKECAQVDFMSYQKFLDRFSSNVAIDVTYEVVVEPKEIADGSE